MTVHELSPEQMTEVKQRYLVEMADSRILEQPSWGELANADELVTDDEIYEYYSDTYFVPDDFCCTCGQ